MLLRIVAKLNTDSNATCSIYGLLNYSTVYAKANYSILYLQHKARVLIGVQKSAFLHTKLYSNTEKSLNVDKTRQLRSYYSHI